MKKIVSFLLFFLASVSAADSTLVLKGVLLDTVFYGKDSLTAELLESGTTFNVTYGKPFTVNIPDDSTWNLCIQSDSIEQCYVINRAPTVATTVIDSLEYEDRFEVYSQFMTAPVPDDSVLIPDSAVTSSSDTFLVDNAVTDIVTQLRPVIIQVRKRPKRRIGQSTVSSKTIERQPGLAEADVIKAIQALPGVVSSSDFSSKIYVRGGGADQNLFLFDNGVVYSPVHFFGLFSTFLVDGIESVDFFKGGFSPVYGNRLSSVVDIKSRKGGKVQNDTLCIKGSAQITTFASTLSLEGSKNALRCNLSGRSTYIKEALGFLREIGATDLDIDYRFYDLQGNIALRLSENQSVTISGYTGRDQLLFSPIETSWGNSVLPVNYYWQCSDKLSFSLAASYSHFGQEFAIENIQTLTNSIMSLGLKPLFRYTGLESHILTAGLESQYFETLFGSSMDIIDYDYEAKKHFSLHSLLFEDKVMLGKIDISAGIRTNYFSTFHALSAEPRLSLSYAVSSEQRFEAHVGYYQQFINSIIFGDMETLNEFYYPAAHETTRDIHPAKSLLFSLGYTHENIFNQFECTWEGYYKTLDNLFVFDPNSQPDSIRNDPNATLGDFIFIGEGYSLGTELSIRRKNGIFSGGLSYAFGFSVQKDHNRAYRAKWEIPHSFKLDGSILWRDPLEPSLWKSKKRYLRSSLQIKYASGLPFTEISGYLPTYYLQQGEGFVPGPSPSLFNNIATPFSGRNNSRYPSYGRVDLKLIDWGCTDIWNFSWTFLNILNRENVFIYVYDTSVQPPERETITQFPFFPILFSFKRHF